MAHRQDLGNQGEHSVPRHLLTHKAEPSYCRLRARGRPGTTLAPMVLAVGLLVVGGIVGWAGASRILDAWLNRWRGDDLTGGPRRHRAASLADEAETWLRQHRP